MKTIISTDQEFRADLIDAHDKIERSLTALIEAPIVLSKALDLLLEEYVYWGNGPKWREGKRKSIIRKAVMLLEEEDKK